MVFNTYAGDWDPLPGCYLTEKAARQAASLQVQRLAILQPAATSGGQSPEGIQDRVYVPGPDGSRYRYLPGNWDVLFSGC